jgi:hypothetical protein
MDRHSTFCGNTSEKENIKKETIILKVGVLPDSGICHLTA